MATNHFLLSTYLVQYLIVDTLFSDCMRSPLTNETANLFYLADDPELGSNVQLFDFIYTEERPYLTLNNKKSYKCDCLHATSHLCL